jgi:hypothetical protein
MELAINDVSNTKLVSYLRDEDRNPVGVMVAIGPNQIGWAFCNKKDRFNKKLGVKIALNRANVGTNHQVPIRWQGEFEKLHAKFQERSVKYFK